MNTLNANSQTASAPSSYKNSSRLRVSILGASGSIGKQALEVARENPDKVEIVGLSVHSDTSFLVDAAKEFKPAYVCVSDPAHANDTCLEQLNSAKNPKALKPEILIGDSGLEEMARFPEADCILIAVVGAAGIKATHTAILSEKRVALANKESLVAAGDLLMTLAKPGQIIPVDSEHSAIFQCLIGETNFEDSLECIWLTCSGGPFYGCTKEQLKGVTAHDALKHPSWTMGPKITIDSATLANKGLEVIEAHHLFNAAYDKIKVLIQPGSTIHSMVSFKDGSTKAQIAASSMKTPISLAFSYPERWPLSDSFVDYQNHAPLSFGKPDSNLFRCLPLAVQAGKEGGIMPAVMNAANEVANAAFRKGRIGFLDIPAVIEKTMDETKNAPLESIDQVLDADYKARLSATQLLNK